MMFTPALRHICTMSFTACLSASASSANHTSSFSSAAPALASARPVPWPAVNMPPRPEAPNEMTDTWP